jgi:hypothetical protein
VNISIAAVPIQQSQGGFSFEGKIVQPLGITTQEFGARWGKFKSESKVSMSSTVRSLDELRMRVTSQLGAQVVEMIAASKHAFAYFLHIFLSDQSLPIASTANEGIVAGQLSGSDVNFCVHIKLKTSGVVDVAVRAPNQVKQNKAFQPIQELVMYMLSSQGLVDALAVFCQQILK